jgi:hypothetical protein
MTLAAAVAAAAAASSMLFHRLVDGRVEKIECEMGGGESDKHFF